jgi:hypothetical protein
MEDAARLTDSGRMADSVHPEPDVPAALHPIEGAAFMATGAALVAHILVDVPLWASVTMALIGAAGVLAVAARRHPGGLVVGRKVLLVGLGSAVAALVAYDVTRLVVAEVANFHVKPFKAFPHFGNGLLGTEGPPTTATWVAGTAFHVVNGLTFGIAYTVAAGRKGVLAGIAFGLGLELVMIGLYPAWLQIPNMREFTTMSMLGHVAYGGTLGYLAQRGLRKVAGGDGADGHVVEA